MTSATDRLLRHLERNPHLDHFAVLDRSSVLEKTEPKSCAVFRRIGRIEDQLGPQVQPDFVRLSRPAPPDRGRQDRPSSNLATPRFSRTLRTASYMEVVRLDGVRTASDSRSA